VDGNTNSYKFSARRTLHPLSTTLYPNNDAMFDQGHTYAKGGVILHMLRRQLGDTDFFRGLGYYLKTNAYKPVDSYDLIQAFQEGIGVNVEPFFAQWIFKPGMPVLDFSWTYDDAKKKSWRMSSRRRTPPTAFRSTTPPLSSGCCETSRPAA